MALKIPATERNYFDFYRIIERLPLPPVVRSALSWIIDKPSSQTSADEEILRNYHRIVQSNPNEAHLAARYLSSTAAKLNTVPPKPGEPIDAYYRILSQGPTLVENRKPFQIPGPALVAAQLKEEREKNPTVTYYNWGMGAPHPGHSIADAAGKACLIKQAEKSSEGYPPALGTDAARQAVSHYNNVRFGISSSPTHSQSVLIASGGKAAVGYVIAGLAQSFNAIGTGQGQGVTGIIYPNPAWPYDLSSNAHLIKPIVALDNHAENGFKITAEQLERAIQAALHPKPGEQIIIPRVLVITSPYNPSGAVYTREELEALVRVALKYDIYVFEDQVYERLVYGTTRKFDPKEHPFVSIAQLNIKVDVKLANGSTVTRTSRERTVFSSALSKNWGRPDLRQAWVWTFDEFPKEIRDNIFKSHLTLQGPVDVNGQAYLTCALNEDSKNLNQGTDILAEEAAFYENRAKVIVPRLNALGLKTTPPKSTFYVVSDISQYYGYWWEDKYGQTHVIQDDESFATYLLKAPQKERIAVIPTSLLSKPGYIRVAFGAVKDDEIEKSLVALENLLKPENLHPPKTLKTQSFKVDHFPRDVDLENISGESLED